MVHTYAKADSSLTRSPLQVSSSWVCLFAFISCVVDKHFPLELGKQKKLQRANKILTSSPRCPNSPRNVGKAKRRPQCKIYMLSLKISCRFLRTISRKLHKTHGCYFLLTVMNYSTVVEKYGLPLGRLRLHFSVKVIYPFFVTSYNAFEQVWVVRDASRLFSAIVIRCCLC